MPVYVGEPRNFSLSRPAAVYVGANDGMLHAFNAETGRELFAYVPASLSAADVTGSGGGLYRLTQQDYQNNHRYYVDMTPTVAEAQIDNAWRTVLVGGLGAGGRGLYALDITNPTTFNEDSVLWEVNASQGFRLGYTFSRPVVAKLNDGRWGVIVGSGYNVTGGNAQLLILSLEGTSRQLRAISVPGSDSLASPTVVDLDQNGTADRVYAGDLQGRMWAFDISSTNPDNWRRAFQNPDTQPLFR
nr:PilC/PilY family type IV pilus protein [Pseudomonadota bacterium]